MRIIRRTKTSDWIPALGGEVTSTRSRAARFSANIVTDSDINVRHWVHRIDSIEKRIQETEIIASTSIPDSL